MHSVCFPDMIQKGRALTPMALPGSIPAEQGRHIIYTEFKSITNSCCELYSQWHTHTFRNKVPLCTNNILCMIGSQGNADAI